MKFIPEATDQSFSFVDSSGTNMSYGGGLPMGRVVNTLNFYGKTKTAVDEMMQQYSDEVAKVVQENEVNGVTSQTDTGTELVSFQTFFKLVKREIPQITKKSLRFWLQSINVLQIEERRIPRLLDQAIARFKFPNRMTSIDEIGQ